MALNRRKTSEIAAEVESAIVEGLTEEDKIEMKKPISVNKVVSTGSTWLDLCISGGRRLEGGIPGGMFMECYGPEGSGKTALLSEICTSTKARGGDTGFKDPEARLDEEYSRIYGMEIDKKNYSMPDTVEEVFEELQEWKPKPEKEGAINFMGVDSLAALSTELELEKGDKMGQRRAKIFSEGFRKSSRIMKNLNILLGCSNQVRDGEFGDTTPGGRALKFYASLRIALKQIGEITDKIKLGSVEEEEDQPDLTRRQKLKLQKEKGINKAELEKVVGIITECFIKKSSVDDPYRKCKIFIVFNYGIDDIRGNLCYMKEMTRSSTYICPDGKSFLSMKAAVAHIEKENLIEALRQQAIKLWHEIEDRFKSNRPKKERG